MSYFDMDSPAKIQKPPYLSFFSFLTGSHLVSFRRPRSPSVLQHSGCLAGWTSEPFRRRGRPWHAPHPIHGILWQAYSWACFQLRLDAQRWNLLTCSLGFTRLVSWFFLGIVIPHFCSGEGSLSLCAVAFRIRATKRKNYWGRKKSQWAGRK